MQYEVKSAIYEVFMQKKTLNSYVIKPITSYRFTENETEKLNKILRKKNKTIHTVVYKRNKLISSRGQCHEEKKH